MTKKFDDFKIALIQLCKDFSVDISAEHTQIDVFDAGKFNNPEHLEFNLEDRTKRDDK